MSDKDIALTISNDLVKPIIEAKIQAAIVSELGKGDGIEFINAIVTRALHIKVDYAGRVSSSNYDNKYDYLESVCAKLIREATDTALRAWVAEHQPQIQAALKKELSRSSGKLATAFAAGLLESMKANFTHTVKVEYSMPKDR